MRKLLLLTTLLLVVSGAFAQWIEQGTNFTTDSRGINYIQCVTGDIVWATAYDGSGNGAYITEFCKTTNSGTLWVPGVVLAGSTYGLGNITALDANTVWVTVFKSGTQNATCGVYKSINGGSTWVHESPLQGSASFADNVYFWNGNIGMCHGDLRDGYFEIYTTTDGGAIWTRVPTTSISGVAVASDEGGWTSVIDVTGNTVMFGTNKGNLYKSDDQGLTWTASFTGASAAGTNGGVNNIAFRDSQSGLVGHVNETTKMFDLFETSDGGTTWAPVTYTGTAFSAGLAYVPYTYNTYVATGSDTALCGASYSFDGGHTWTEFNATNGTQFLYTKWYDNAHGWAGSFNSTTTANTGMFKYNDVLAEIVHVDAQKGGFVIYPNPNHGLFTLAAIGVENQEVTIQVFDMVGKMVYSAKDNQSIISYNKEIDLSGLSRGTYFVNVVSGKTTHREKIVIE
ncbi:MAG: T9SS type A sorting domain-containing protein [Bacteroidetes bacterium]|nr:T9SS type A sorting domain-containing protein [Bacteroidota bacterium]